MPDTALASQMVEELRAYVREAANLAGTTEAVNPGHRAAFHWPPPPPSYRYHLLASDWSGRASFEAHGEEFEVETAQSPYGCFGRCPATWHEAKGATMDEMLSTLKRSAEPLFKRQFAIAKCLGQEARFTGTLRDLDPLSLLKLLYCPDRDVASSAKTEVETHASLRIFGAPLVFILEDRTHPLRRSAQWCVLDLFEDLTSFSDTPDVKSAAVAAMKGILWDAQDDYARTVYKAGVVLGGHIPAEIGGPVLIDCLNAPSRIGRRSAIHGLFHVVEWEPEMKKEVTDGLRKTAESDTEPILRKYAGDMLQDIEAGSEEHVSEPAFDDEN